MKFGAIKLLSLIIASIMLISSIGFTLSSCTKNSEEKELKTVEASVDNGKKNEETSSEEKAENTEPSSSTSSSENKSEIITEVTNNTINITANGGSTAHATAAGLRSAVSIYCVFEATVLSGSYWNPVPTTKSYYTTGSGVIYKLEGGDAIIITNFHVVYDSSSNTENHISDKIYLFLYGMENEKYAIPATYVGGSANYDIAVLYVENSSIISQAAERGSISAAKVSNSDDIVPGDTTIAVGNPSATSISGISATKGIVSVDSEYISMTAPDNSGTVAYRVLRTDTAVNAGNSGGGLYNDKGELIGIVNAKFSSSNVENIGYAIPSNVVRAVADNIIDNCLNKTNEKVMRVVIDISLQTDEMYTVYDPETGLLKRYETVIISAIPETSSAIGKLMVGDIITSVSVNGKKVNVARKHDYLDALLDARNGSQIEITVLRGAEEFTETFTVVPDMIKAY